MGIVSREHTSRPTGMLRNRVELSRPRRGRSSRSRR